MKKLEKTHHANIPNGKHYEILLHTFTFKTAF